jgi:hypothetical protein
LLVDIRTGQSCSQGTLAASGSGVSGVKDGLPALRRRKYGRVARSARALTII